MLYQSLSMAIKIKNNCIFLILGKKQRKLALLENKKFDKGCYEPSEHILYSKFFSPLNYGGNIIRHSLTNFCLSFLINQVVMSGSRWRWVGGKFIVKHYGKDWGMSLEKYNSNLLLAEFSGSFISLRYLQNFGSM